jgi:hypothetical protein
VFKLTDLLRKVAGHAVNLLNHGLGQDLDLCTDFNGGHRSSCDQIARIDNWGFTGNQLAKASIPASGLDALAPVLNIQNAFSRSDAHRILVRPVQRGEVFVEVHCHKVAQVGRPMNIALPVEQFPEFGEQSVFNQGAPSHGLRRPFV